MTLISGNFPSHLESELPTASNDSNFTIKPNNNDNTSPSLSATSSISNSMSNASSRYQGRRYNGKLPISDIPELIELCSQFLKTQNITGLAMIARQSGLPPHLRCKIWPILLKYHPFVQDPYIEIDIDDDNEEDEEYDDADEDEDEDDASDNEDFKDNRNKDDENRKNKTNNNKSNNNYTNNADDDNTNKETNNHENTQNNYKIPIKEIKFDLKKYLRSSERYIPKVLTNEIKDLFEIQYKIFDVIEHAIIKFLKKWGSIIHYNSGLTWIALGLAEWIPPLINSQFVLCGRDDVAKNGTKLRNINDSYFEKLNNSNLTSESSSIFESPFSSSPDSFTPLASLANTPTKGFKSMSFAEVYERMVLVILHTPDPSNIEKLEISKKISISKELKQLSLLPYTGGTISDRISFFLFSMRKLLPELHNYLSEEDCLNGDWMLWWLKYAGSKVWSRYDRGRTWDLLLGYRTNYKNFESNMKELYELTPEQIRLLGQDIFWNPMDNLNDDDDGGKNDDVIVDNDDNNEDYNNNNSTINDEREIYRDKHDRSLSVLTIMSKNTIDKTPTLGSLSLNSPKTPLNLNIDDEIEPISELPFSKIHPHVELIFISLAFLKSKEFTITELDQSEIKTLFGRLSSLKTDSGEMSSFVGTKDENKQLNNNGNNTSNTNIIIDNRINNSINVADGLDNANINHETMVNNSRKSNRDIENIIIEAGELWRRFLYINMMEETDIEKV
jgi:hypothetical protein